MKYMIFFFDLRRFGYFWSFGSHRPVNSSTPDLKKFLVRVLDVNETTLNFFLICTHQAHSMTPLSLQVEFQKNDFLKKWANCAWCVQIKHLPCLILEALIIIEHVGIQPPYLCGHLETSTTRCSARVGYFLLLKFWLGFQ